VNTHYHQQWSPSTNFIRGYAISSHENELGIATELGLVGLALWLAVLIPLIWCLLKALKRLPVDGLVGRRLGLLAVTVLGAWVVSGLAVDLRFFDFANLLVFLLVGAVLGVADALPGTDRRKGSADSADPRPGLDRVPVGAL
jgi:O-antigen ligase